MECYEILSLNNWRTYNSQLAKEIGINEAILLSELCYKYDYWLKQNSIDEDGYFYLTTEDCYSDTALTKYQQSKAIDNLVKLGLISFKNKGVPQKRHFKLLQSELLNILTSKSKQSEQLEVNKVDGTSKQTIKQSNNYTATTDECVNKTSYSASEEDSRESSGDAYTLGANENVFIPPTIDDLIVHATLRGYGKVDFNYKAFFEYYEDSDWKDKGGNRINWKHTLIKWIKNEKPKQNYNKTKKVGLHNPEPNKDRAEWL